MEEYAIGIIIGYFWTFLVPFILFPNCPLSQFFFPFIFVCQVPVIATTLVIGGMFVVFLGVCSVLGSVGYILDCFLHAHRQIVTSKSSKMPNLVTLNVWENKENLVGFLLDSTICLYIFCIYPCVHLFIIPWSFYYMTCHMTLSNLISLDLWSINRLAPLVLFMILHISPQFLRYYYTYAKSWHK